MTFAAVSTPSGSSTPQSASETTMSTALAQLSGLKSWTDFQIAALLRNAYPNEKLCNISTQDTNIFKYADAGFASYSALPELTPFDMQRFVHANKRGTRGTVETEVKFGAYTYTWLEKTFTVYRVSWPRPAFTQDPTDHTYILGDGAEGLVLVASEWAQVLHEEIWVFDNSSWSKSSDLFRSVQETKWSDVVLPHGMLSQLRADVEGFFKSKDIYWSLGVAWKRGMIFYGPPGNGKSITIKCLIDTLLSDDFPSAVPVQALYVKALTNPCNGEQASLANIFEKARKAAPCVLIFEDVDSLITDKTRSYFLNEVDGLQSNDGILMIGSTNHLERLDVGISNRPSRFDRKYHFAPPDWAARRNYAEYWAAKVQGNGMVVCPPALADAVADVTEGFTFAYLKEAFVASLLWIATGRTDEPEEMQSVECVKKEGLEDSILWKVLQWQVFALKKDIALAAGKKPGGGVGGEEGGSRA